MIITIDGPAGSGKSTAARKLAAHLEIAYLDTGAMYRALAYSALQGGVVATDDAALLAHARSADVALDCGPTHTRIRVDGHDVSEAIRTMTVSAMTPFVAALAEIRALLVKRQREIARELGSLVTEGRDQGSTVFPDADAKFVLDATLQKRAERRFQELVAEGEDVRIEEVLENLQQRDAVDARQWESLLPPGRAVVIDTTALSISEVVRQMVEVIESPTRRTP
ncbi:MAG: (d)CMP kinase [Phycisphaerae bacterium]